MPFRTLADFLDDLGRAGELAAVDAEVDPCLEIAEVTRRIARQNGPALLFRSVRGHDIPLLTNLFGTESRILRALGAESIEEATERIDRALNSGGGEGWLERLRFGGKSGAATGYAANRVKSGACQQIVRLGSDVNLLELPLLHWNEEVKTPAIYSAIMLSADPETHAQVFLQGDLQITGRDTAVAVWSEIADPSRLTSACRNLGGRMPLAVVIGGDPAVQLAAAAPLPSAVDPLGLAGLLREKPLDAVACRSVDLSVPAESDFVIEGYIEPADSGVDGEPRLSLTGRVLRRRPGHVMHVSAVTHRANAVFPAAAPSINGNECCVRDRLLARLFLPYLKLRIPELFDADLPLCGGARHMAVLAIKKCYGDQARHVATVASGMRPFQFAKLTVIVDAKVDVRDADQVFAAIVQEGNCGEEAWEMAGPGDPLDPTSPWGSYSRRVAIDATRRLVGEAATSQADPPMPVQHVANLVADRWAEYGLGPEPQP